MNPYSQYKLEPDVYDLFAKRAWNSGFSGGMGKRAWNSGFTGNLKFVANCLFYHNQYWHYGDNETKSYSKSFLFVVLYMNKGGGPNPSS